MYFDADVVPGQPFWISRPTAPGGREVNPAAFSIPTFATPADSRQGMLGRNSRRAFNSVQTDLSLSREFAIYEQLKLTFRIDGFKILNHANVGLPLNSLTATGFWPAWWHSCPDLGNR